MEFLSWYPVSAFIIKCSRVSQIEISCCIELLVKKWNLFFFCGRFWNRHILGSTSGFLSLVLNYAMLSKTCAVSCGLQLFGNHRLLLKGCWKVTVKNSPIVSYWEVTTNNILRTFQGEWIRSFPISFHCGSLSSLCFAVFLPQKLQNSLNISQKKTLGEDANTGFPLRQPFLLLNELHE